VNFSKRDGRRKWRVSPKCVNDTFGALKAILDDAASARDHHSVPGGLAVHSLQVAGDLACHRDLSDLERDLGIAGALLHDIGKVWSYTEDMFPNAASPAMGHALVGLCRLEPELMRLEQEWADGAFVMRTLLSGNARVRGNGSLPSALLPRIKACDQCSCERDRAAKGMRSTSRPVWTPNAWRTLEPAGGYEF
jgi:3'-5' exoribonuclease